MRLLAKHGLSKLAKTRKRLLQSYCVTKLYCNRAAKTFHFTFHIKILVSILSRVNSCAPGLQITMEFFFLHTFSPFFKNYLVNGLKPLVLYFLLFF